MTEPRNLKSLADEAAIVEEKLSRFIQTLEPHQRTQGVLMGALFTIICDIWEVGRDPKFGDDEFLLMSREFLKTSRKRNKNNPDWKLER